jgi:hypothetical protein
MHGSEATLIDKNNDKYNEVQRIALGAMQAAQG